MRAFSQFAVALWVAALFVAAAATASSPGRNGSLLISISRPANAAGTSYTPASLYSLRAGRSLHLLARAPVESLGSASYSPDGATIAFPRVDRTTRKLGLWLMRADGGHARQIAPDGQGGAFAWSPDNRHLALFLPILAEIVLIDLHGRQVAVLGRGVVVRELDWSPDGRTIYFEGNGASSSTPCRPGICALMVPGGKVRQVVTDDQRGTSWSHHWITVSPDSKHIAFVRDCYSGACTRLTDTDGLVVADANGSHAHVLVRAAIGWPVWSPDASSIAYVNQWAGSGPAESTVELVSASTGVSTPFKVFPATPPADHAPPTVQLLSWQSR